MPSHLPLNLTNLPHPLNIHSATHSPIHFSLRSSATLSQGSSNFLSGNLPCVWGQCLGQRAGGYQRKLTGKVPVESQHLPMPNLRQEQIEGARRQCYVLEVGSQSEAFRACSSLAGSVMHPDSQEALSSVALFTYFLAPPPKKSFPGAFLTMKPQFFSHSKAFQNPTPACSGFTSLCLPLSHTDILHSRKHQVVSTSGPWLPLPGQPILWGTGSSWTPMDHVGLLLPPLPAVALALSLLLSPVCVSTMSLH